MKTWMYRGIASACVCLSSFTDSGSACPPNTWCSPNPNPLACVWNPTYSDCDIGYVQTHTECECVNGSCSFWVATDRAIIRESVDMPEQFGDRPNGACIDIPCGKCFAKDKYACRKDYTCATREGINECSAPDNDCGPFALGSFITERWMMTGEDCCVDAQ